MGPMGRRYRHICGTSPQKSLPLMEAVLPNRRQAERHLSLLKNDRDAKEEDESQCQTSWHPAISPRTRG